MTSLIIEARRVTLYEVSILGVDIFRTMRVPNLIVQPLLLRSKKMRFR